MKNTIFDTHPNLDCYFETADGSCFFTENAAASHSKTLEDKRVKLVHRPEVKEDVEPSQPLTPVQPVAPIEPPTPVQPELIEPLTPAQPVAPEPQDPVEPKNNANKK